MTKTALEQSQEAVAQQDVSGKLTVAVPIMGGKLCSHFGHCEQFAFYEVDMKLGRIESSRRLDPPPHEPGLLPRWLSTEQVQLVIAGGMGQRARDIFSQQGIQVVVGAPSQEPHHVVQAYLDGKLMSQPNPCDH